MAERFVLDRASAVLVVVDIQERLVAAMSEGDRVIENCLKLIGAAGLLGLPSILTEQYPKGLGPTVGRIRDALSGVRPVEKLSFGCCQEPGFIGALESPGTAGRKQVVIAGMEAHVCVLQTCLGLLERGYSVHVVRDAVCSRKKVDFRTGLEIARDAGAVVTSTETVLFQLLGSAGTDEFRAVSRLIK